MVSLKGSLKQAANLSKKTPGKKRKLNAQVEAEEKDGEVKTADGANAPI